MWPGEEDRDGRKVSRTAANTLFVNADTAVGGRNALMSGYENVLSGTSRFSGHRQITQFIHNWGAIWGLLGAFCKIVNRFDCFAIPGVSKQAFS